MTVKELLSTVSDAEALRLLDEYLVDSKVNKYPKQNGQPRVCKERRYIATPERLTAFREARAK